MNKNDCCCSNGTVTILACSGGSNVGQLTNEAAKQLDIEGVGKFFCLAGVGGHVSGMVASVEGSEKVLVLDGCPAACAKKTMDAAELKDYSYLVVTELGIEKEHNFNFTEQDIEKVLSAAYEKLSEKPEERNEAELVEIGNSGGADCCCGGCNCC